MTRTFYISGGNSGFFQTLIRTTVLIAASIGGLFLLAASAAFAMIVAIGLLILGAFVFVGFWVRSKIRGKPLSPFARMRKDFEAQMHAASFGEPFMADNDMAENESTAQQKRAPQSGPIIDAHETPDGWSVDGQ